MKRLVLTLVILSVTFIQIKAQNEEYQWEFGGAVGSSFYLGDANYSRLYRGNQLAGGIQARYHLNPHMAIRGSLNVGGISGDGKNLNVFPEGTQTEFKRTIADLGAQFEYNFWGYGMGHTYRSVYRLAPYILGGFGLTFAPKPAQTIATLNIPLGVGVKYKLAPRINMGIEWAIHFSLCDKLDVTTNAGNGLNDPYLIKGKGLKNNDSYVMTMLFLTYDLFPKCKDCNN